ncbi:hemolysin III family protein [Curtobacterium sp. MCBD17_019]|uniref:PAQR family membrane homeostasis protein TrhA n=1 Tax=Curtobacterium sp. MCBD17_019 TaxID=2175669 RepID=UPI000DA7EBC3|nr:hemolysin III family protein [Curtobacterium sp. MCBD17_019]PZE75413.1 hemolysin III family protein [Curtobacterium sp. MCBD17_019]
MTDPSPDALPHVPFVEEAEEARDASVAPAPVPPPAWRGWIHLGAFPVAAALGIVLVCLAATPAAKAASAVFTAASLVLFGVSATYHRFRWSPRVKVVLKRIDHTNIFLLIAGTYTPVAVCALGDRDATVLLVVMWSGAALGMAFRVFWVGAPRWLYVPLYVLLGCSALFYLPQLFAADTAMMVLVLTGGLAYVLGAAVYGFKRPDPAPRVFGFHEVFHALTVVAFVAQWAGVLVVALHPVR